eukprot:jgi/Bigna1/66896/fgenesh1_pg.2_\
MTDFLSNVAGQTLLSIVARGSAIIAELRRLSDHIPSVFLRPANDTKSKYAPIILDFRYLKNPDEYEERIEKNEETAELDEEFRENHLALLERFYSLFESIHKFISDWLAYLDELAEGTFVQHTTEGVLLDVEGKQLMAEALYLYGCMLLLMDLRIPGLARERMLISYYRYKGASTIPNIDEVCKLCRSTGYSPSGRRPSRYPEEYFARVKIPKATIKMIVSRLRSDDIYNRRKAYPSPEHRSTALATQSAMLYTILYFAPTVLEKEQSMMREIVILNKKKKKKKMMMMRERSKMAMVDKHFNDNWVVPFQMGFAVDLSQAWEPYRAARLALDNILNKQNVTDVTERFATAVNTLNAKLLKYLTKGVLNEPFVMSNIRVLMHCVRDCNALTRVKKNANLQQWFKKLAEQVGSLDFSNAVVAGRNIAHLIRHLEEVEQFHQIESSMQVKAFLADTRDYMTRMIRTVNITDSVLADLETISDFAYACEIDRSDVVYCFCGQRSSSCRPFWPSLWFESRNAAPKMISPVAEYYSGDLVRYIRKVLEIVPQSVFNTLALIINLLTHKMKTLPTKLERLHLQQYSQLPERYTLARATHQVSVFTRGILNMKTTLVGIVQLDPRQLLEDGIRKELVRRIASALHKQLVFETGKVSEFESKLKDLETMKGGFSRIIAYSVEQECNSFLKRKVFDWQSIFQSDAIPIPQFQPLDKRSVNFMGRLVRELLAQTDPRKTVYIECNQGWYNQQLREVVGIRTFDFLYRGVGVFGLCGVDRLICFMIVRDLNLLTRTYRKQMDFAHSKYVSGLMEDLKPASSIPRSALKLYAQTREKLSRLLRLMTGVVVSVGTAQLLRRQVANQLNFLCKLDSKLLSCSLSAVNDSLIKDVRAHYQRPDSKEYPANPLLPEVAKHLDTAGFNNPLTKIYITSEPLHGLSCVMFLFVLEQLQKSHVIRSRVSETPAPAPAMQRQAYNRAYDIHLKWNKKISTLTAKNQRVITILKQFHSSHTTQFLRYLAQYVNVSVSGAKASRNGNLPTNAISALLFLEQFCSFSKIDRKIVDSLVPAYLLDRFTHD